MLCYVVEVEPRKRQTAINIVVFFYAYMATYNFYCLDCENTYTSEVEKTEERETQWGKFDCTQCEICGGMAKVVGIPTAPISITPPWGAYEKGIHTGTPEEQIRAGDKFSEERSRWTSSGKWRDWEAGRKKDWERNKKYWHQHNERAEQEKKQNFIKKVI